MNIAFYAPMKSPAAARPSGDRTIGRLLMAALQGAGYDVRLASQLRTWSDVPDSARLDEFHAAARQDADALIGAYTAGAGGWAPDIWFTYHSYYKAPDLLGPRVAAALGIPYIITEASYASRRAAGAWADWLAAARHSITAAEAIFSFTARDRAGLADICPANHLHSLAPFLDLDIFDTPAAPTPEKRTRTGAAIRIVTLAMMRPGAKLASYRLLAASLATLLHLDWHLDIIGDGDARNAVEAAFAELPSDRLHWHGQLDAPFVRQVLAASDVFVWPGIEEAFGVAYLEAQAAGLPVAALRTAGVPEVVRHGETGYLANNATPPALAACIERLLDDPVRRRQLGASARAAIENHHSLPAASAVLGRVLGQLVLPQQSAQ